MFKFLSCVIFILKLFVMGVYAQEPHHQTAYIGQEGETQVLLTYSSYTTDHFWGPSGIKLPTYNHFFQSSVFIYAEYALNRSNSLTLNSGYSAIEETVNGNSRGIQDIDIGWKHLLYRENSSVLTGQVIALIPLQGAKSSIRYAEAGVEVDVLYSSTAWINEHPCWCDLEIGYRHYHGFPSDQVKGGSAIGYEFYKCCSAILSLHLDYGVFNGKTQRKFNNIVFSPNYRLMTLQLEFLINMWSYSSISLGGYWRAWGENSGAGGGYFCGAWFDF